MVLPNSIAQLPYHVLLNSMITCQCLNIGFKVDRYPVFVTSADFVIVVNTLS